jgi:hypothetical protein
VPQHHDPMKPGLINHRFTGNQVRVYVAHLLLPRIAYLVGDLASMVARAGIGEEAITKASIANSQRISIWMLRRADREPDNRSQNGIRPAPGWVPG